ncbi:MAG: hypothetical protein HOY79_49790 [Streptomyces sp.]|nr:hypothetical protein [Streptomyces sp.]
MRTLLLWHDPLTGYLKSRTRAYNIMDRLDISESTLRRARRKLIHFGLIVSYVPGDGRIASTYVVARSWDEAGAAVKLRESLGEDAPHFPELVDRTPSAVDKRPAPPAGDDEGQEQDETDEERQAAKERLDRAKRRRGVKGPVPPEIPSPSALPELLEVEERKADPERQGDTNERGAASVRAVLAARNGAA